MIRSFAGFNFGKELASLPVIGPTIQQSFYSLPRSGKVQIRKVSPGLTQRILRFLKGV
jgi:hypothetical protein